MRASKATHKMVPKEDMGPPPPRQEIQGVAVRTQERLRIELEETKERDISNQETKQKTDIHLEERKPETQLEDKELKKIEYKAHMSVKDRKALFQFENRKIQMQTKDKSQSLQKHTEPQVRLESGKTQIRETMDDASQYTQKEKAGIQLLPVQREAQIEAQIESGKWKAQHASEVKQTKLLLEENKAQTKDVKRELFSHAMQKGDVKKTIHSRTVEKKYQSPPKDRPAMKSEKIVFPILLEKKEVHYQVEQNKPRIKIENFEVPTNFPIQLATIKTEIQTKEKEDKIRLEQRKTELQPKTKTALEDTQIEPVKKQVKTRFYETDLSILRDERKPRIQVKKRPQDAPIEVEDIETEDVQVEDEKSMQTDTWSEEDEEVKPQMESKGTNTDVVVIKRDIGLNAMLQDPELYTSRSVDPDVAPILTIDESLDPMIWRYLGIPDSEFQEDFKDDASLKNNGIPQNIFARQEIPVLLTLKRSRTILNKLHKEKNEPKAEDQLDMNTEYFDTRIMKLFETIKEEEAVDHQGGVRGLFPDYLFPLLSRGGRTKYKVTEVANSTEATSASTSKGPILSGSGDQYTLGRIFGLVQNYVSFSLFRGGKANPKEEENVAEMDTTTKTTFASTTTDSKYADKFLSNSLNDIWGFVRSYVIFPLFSRGGKTKSKEEDKVVKEATTTESTPAPISRDPTPLTGLPADQFLKVGIQRDSGGTFRLERTDVRGQLIPRDVAIQTDNLEGKGDEEEKMEETDETIEKEDKYGMFADNERRVDFVLVMSDTHDNPEVEKIKLDYMMGLVKTGIQIEVVAGIVPEHKHLQFVKLHATDALLETYAEIFAVKRYFRDSHENNIRFQKWSLIDRLFRLRYEREWLRLLRKNYVKPLRISNLDRSYIVYMLLLHQKFGQPENYYGLKRHVSLVRKLEVATTSKITINVNEMENPPKANTNLCAVTRLLRNQIILDAYALHDGKAFPPKQHPGTLNCRQILYLYWTGYNNILKYQPLNLIYEYFGAKVAFYFALYELYNKTLLIASIWGIFMTILYLIKDKEYHKNLRHFACSTNLREPTLINDAISNELYSWKVTRSQVCSECEGESSPRLCPNTFTEYHCADLQLMKYFDNPYVILYSMGMTVLALMFRASWKRTEYYWRWMWEEEKYLKRAHIARAEYRPHKRGILHIIRYILLNMVSECILPAAAIFIIIVTILFTFVYLYTWTRPMSVEVVQFPKDYDALLMYCKNSTNQSTCDLDMAVPNIKKSKEYELLILEALLVQVLFYGIEKLYHLTTYLMTEWENHRTQEQFEESLVKKIFTISLVYSSSIIIYFGFLKDGFYVHPLWAWDGVFDISLPWYTRSFNMTKILPTTLSQLLRRTLSMNCGLFSCLRQAVVVYLVVMVFRCVIVKLLEAFFRLRHHKGAMSKVPTSERQYKLQPLTERRVLDDINSIVLQFALVFLFAPLFPLMPLIAFFINLWELRSKASFYLVHCRRALLFKTPGLKPWNLILRLICYAVPLFHAVTITRTEIFKKYMFHKYRLSHAVIMTPNYAYGPHSRGQNMDVGALQEDYINFLLFGNFYLKLVNHSRHYATNLHKIYRHLNFTRFFEGIKDRLYDRRGIKYYPLLRDVCRFDGFFVPLRADKVSDRWPFQWNYMMDNVSYVAPDVWHYELKFYKTVFILVYLLLFSLAAVMMWRYFDNRSSSVMRRRYRERTLMRLRIHELRFVTPMRPVPRPETGDPEVARLHK